MKKTFTFIMLLVACMFTASVRAQSKGGFKLNLGAEGALPVGDAANGYTFGIGLSAKGEMPLSPSWKITASAGFTSFSFTEVAKNIHLINGDNETSAAFVPVEVGARYYFSKKFYGEGQVGAVFGTNNTISSAGVTPDSGTSFAYTPGVGILLPVNGDEAIDIGVRYEAWTRSSQTLGFLGLRVAYKFSFK